MEAKNPDYARMRLVDAGGQRIRDEGMAELWVVPVNKQAKLLVLLPMPDGRGWELFEQVRPDTAHAETTLKAALGGD